MPKRAKTVAQRTRRAPARKTPATRLLVLTLHNEAQFALEWIAYHRALGFNRIMVLSDGSDRAINGLLEALDKNDIIDHRVDPSVSADAPQANAARLVNDTGILKDADWAMWLDVDEFLVVSTGDGTLSALIDALGDRDGMLIPRRMMGDGGNDRFPGRFVSEDFTDAAAAEHDSNLEMKTLFRCSDHIEGFAMQGVHRPKIREGVNPAHLNFMMATGNALDLRHRANRRWVSGEDFNRARRVLPGEHGYALAQINCYSVRTPEHFALKHTPASAQGNAANVAEMYRDNNHAATLDRRILRLADATAADLDHLRGLSGVAKAEADIATDVSARIADIPADVLDACIATRPARATPQVFPLTLPDEEAALVRAEYEKADVILEYGSGGSSFVALESGAKKLFTVESDRSWALTIHDCLLAAHPHADFTVQYVDIGATKAWGKPTNSESYEQYTRYPSSVWDLMQFEQPEVVLVDGRFRVACFLTTLFRTKSPVTLLFDDYTGRPFYHWIERYAQPTQIAGRMARFEIKPMSIPTDDLSIILSAYADLR